MHYQDPIKEPQDRNQPDDQARVHIWVSGLVQGVGFRAFVLQAGTRLALVGWVHNLGYDQVETVAEGPRPVLERFTEDVSTGPRASRVEDARVEWESPLGEFKRFDVK
jgi:acylphosphatase